MNKSFASSFFVPVVPLWQVRVLQAVDRETSPCFVVAVLEIRNNRVVDVLLLLAQELGTDRVECVRTQLVITLDDLENIKLDTAKDRNVLALARAVRLGRERGVLHC